MAGTAVDEEGQRAALYELLSALLAAPPDSRQLATLAEMRGGSGDLGEAVTALAAAAAATTPEKAAAEYHALFIGVGRGELVPYASYYLTGFMQGKPLVRLRTDLAALGIERAAGIAEPEDGIAFLCAVMAGLITGTFGEPASLEAQHRFFDAHLAPWSPRFFADLEAARNAALYRPVGTLGRRFLEVETEAFAIPE